MFGTAQSQRCPPPPALIPCPSTQLCICFAAKRSQFCLRILQVRCITSLPLWNGGGAHWMYPNAAVVGCLWILCNHKHDGRPRS